MDNEDIVNGAVSKIIGMFSAPPMERFLNFDAKDVICGPNDRAIVGFDTYFPLDWLVEDYGFTKEEARWFIDAVHKKRE